MAEPMIPSEAQQNRRDTTSSFKVLYFIIFVLPHFPFLHCQSTSFARLTNFFINQNLIN